MDDEKLLFLSQDWLNAYMEALNENTDYEEAAKTWEGSFIFQVDDDKTLNEPIRAYMDLWHGKCREVRKAEPDETAEYVVSSSIENWRKLLEGEFGPIKGLISRKLRLEGSMTKVMRYMKAAVQLVETTKQIPTKFPDDE
jgi:putative sterol carrier protein